MSFLSRLIHSSDSSTKSPNDFARGDQDGAQVIDVRTSKEFATGHLSGSVNVNVHDHDFKIQIEGLERSGVLEKGKPVYLYCRSGARSGTATRTLMQMGFVEATNVGGYGALKAAGLDIDEPV